MKITRQNLDSAGLTAIPVTRKQRLIVKLINDRLRDRERDAEKARERFHRTFGLRKENFC